MLQISIHKMHENYSPILLTVFIPLGSLNKSFKRYTQPQTNLLLLTNVQVGGGGGEQKNETVVGIKEDEL